MYVQLYKQVLVILDYRGHFSNKKTSILCEIYFIVQCTSSGPVIIVKFKHIHIQYIVIICLNTVNSSHIEMEYLQLYRPF